MYVLSCDDCVTEYEFRRRKRLREFGHNCPVCGRYMSPVPLTRYVFTPPPKMKEIPRQVKVVRVK